MSTITIPIEDEDLEFLNAWTREVGTTVEAFFAKEASTLRRHLATPLHPDLINASGIISGTTDAEGEHIAHLADKHA